MQEILIYTIGNNEYQQEVPKGFWAMEREQLKQFLYATYKGIDWASNGSGDPLWAINIYFSK